MKVIRQIILLFLISILFLTIVMCALATTGENEFKKQNGLTTMKLWYSP